MCVSTVHLSFRCFLYKHSIHKHSLLKHICTDLISLSTSFLFPQINDGKEEVVLVYKLISDGVAKQDGRLKKYDQLVSINGINVVNETVSVIVERLTSTMCGPVILGVKHAICAYCTPIDSEDTVGI